MKIEQPPNSAFTKLTFWQGGRKKIISYTESDAWVERKQGRRIGMLELKGYNCKSPKKLLLDVLT